MQIKAKLRGSYWVQADGAHEPACHVRTKAWCVGTTTRLLGGPGTWGPTPAPNSASGPKAAARGTSRKELPSVRVTRYQSRWQALGPAHYVPSGRFHILEKPMAVHTISSTGSHTKLVTEAFTVSPRPGPFTMELRDYVTPTWTW